MSRVCFGRSVRGKRRGNRILITLGVSEYLRGGEHCATQLIANSVYRTTTRTTTTVVVAVVGGDSEGDVETDGGGGGSFREGARRSGIWAITGARVVKFAYVGHFTSGGDGRVRGKKCENVIKLVLHPFSSTTIGGWMEILTSLSA